VLFFYALIILHNARYSEINGIWKSQNETGTRSNRSHLSGGSFENFNQGCENKKVFEKEKGN